MPFEGVWALGESNDVEEAEMILTIRRASNRIYELVWVDADENEFDGIGLEQTGGKAMSFYSYPSDEEDLDEDEMDDEETNADGTMDNDDDMELDDMEGVEISIGYFQLSDNEQELVETTALPADDEISEVRYRWVSTLEEAEQSVQE